MDLWYVLIIGAVSVGLGYSALRYRRQARRWMELAEKYDSEADAWYSDWLRDRLDEHS